MRRWIALAIVLAVVLYVAIVLWPQLAVMM